MTQEEIYNLQQKEHMIESISYALDFMEANSYETDEIMDAMEGLRKALNFINNQDV